MAEYPALLSWQGNDSDGGLLGIATGSFGDSFDTFREQHYTRAECAELLIDAGAIVTPSVLEGIIDSRARGLLQLFQRKGLLPRTLKFLSALGDLDAVRASLGESGNDLAAVNAAFLCACRFEHEAVASVLLERSIALDPELGKHVDGIGGRLAFIKYLSENRSHYFGARHRTVATMICCAESTPAIHRVQRRARSEGVAQLSGRRTETLIRQRRRIRLNVGEGLPHAG